MPYFFLTSRLQTPTNIYTDKRCQRVLILQKHAQDTQKPPSELVNSCHAPVKVRPRHIYYTLYDQQVTHNQLGLTNGPAGEKRATPYQIKISTEKIRASHTKLQSTDSGGHRASRTARERERENRVGQVLNRYERCRFIHYVSLLTRDPGS